MSTYDDYLHGLTVLTTLDEAAERQRAEIREASRSAMAAADDAGRRADSELAALDEQRNRVQREVAGLCREVGVPMVDEAAPQFATLHELRRALDDTGRQVERIRKDWQWAERYRRQQPVAPPVPAAPAPPPPPPPPIPVDESSRGFRPAFAIVAVLFLVVLIAVLVLVLL